MTDPYEELQNNMELEFFHDEPNEIGTRIHTV